MHHAYELSKQRHQANNSSTADGLKVVGVGFKIICCCRILLLSGLESGANEMAKYPIAAAIMRILQKTGFYDRLLKD